MFSQGKDMVNATQVLLMLALFCRGEEYEQDRRLGLCFDLLDVSCVVFYCHCFGVVASHEAHIACRWTSRETCPKMR